MKDQLNRSGSSPLAVGQIEDALTRHDRSWMADGIVEIVLGSFWLLWGLIVVLPLIFHDRTLVELRLVLLLSSMGAMPFVLRRAIRGWKERMSFPRTGYVELQQRPSRWKVGFIVIGAGAAYQVAILGSRGSRSLEQWMSLGLGVLMFLAMLLPAWRIRAIRLAVLSWLVLGTAMASFLLQLEFTTCAGVLLLVYAFVCLVDGLLRMRSYLKVHPSPPGEAS